MRRIPHALMFIGWPKSYGMVIYSPAHDHAPGDDVPVTASWLIIF